ncbi:unnamed protein product [Rotaria sp. Silwood1]|nr:unnamed protein product [Rotaria sp. Silwood1]
MDYTRWETKKFLKINTKKAKQLYGMFGIAKETHQLAQANDEKNRKLREAFGIGEFDKKKIAEKKTEEAKEAERRKAELVNKQIFAST